MSDPAALRAALGEPPLTPACRLDAYWAAVAAGAEAAPPSPAGAADRARMILGPDIRASIARQQGKSGRAA